MIERKSKGSKSSHGNKSKTSHIKPSKYMDMVVSALQSLKDSRGSIPKNIVGYIANTYDIKTDREVISSNVYRALKQGLDDDLIVKNSYGHYSLAAKAKRRKIPAKKRSKKRKGKKRGKKKRAKKRTRRRKKATKKRKKRGKPRRYKLKRRRNVTEDSEERPRRRARKKDQEEPPRRGRPRKKDQEGTK